MCEIAAGKIQRNFDSNNSLYVYYVHCEYETFYLCECTGAAG